MATNILKRDSCTYICILLKDNDAYMFIYTVYPRIIAPKVIKKRLLSPPRVCVAIEYLPHFAIQSTRIV